MVLCLGRRVARRRRQATLYCPQVGGLHRKAPGAGGHGLRRRSLRLLMRLRLLPWLCMLLRLLIILRLLLLLLVLLLLVLLLPGWAVLCWIALRTDITVSISAGHGGAVIDHRSIWHVGFGSVQDHGSTAISLHAGCPVCTADPRLWWTSNVWRWELMHPLV